MVNINRKIVSVIMPTYNVEKYVGKCLESLLNQTYNNLEIIIIDDYSTDKTVSLIKEITRNDNRVKLIELNKHIGVAPARNIGLDNVTGEYLYFLDSDDFIDSDYIKNMVDAIENNDVDMVSNYNIVIYDWKKNNEQFWWNRKLKDGILKLHSRNMYSIPNMLWCNLYKTAFIKNNNIRFIEKDLPYEDLYFNSIVFSYINKICITSKSRYYYRFRKKSLTGKNNKRESRYELIEVTELLYNYFKDHDLLDKSQLNFLELKGRLHKHKNKVKYYSKIRSLFLDINDGVVCNTSSWTTSSNIKFFNDVLNNKNYLLYKLFNNEYEVLLKIRLFHVFPIFEIKECSNKLKIYILSIPFIKTIKKAKKTYIKLFGFIPLLKIKNSQ